MNIRCAQSPIAVRMRACGKACSGNTVEFQSVRVEFHLHLVVEHYGGHFLGRELRPITMIQKRLETEVLLENQDSNIIDVTYL